MKSREVPSTEYRVPSEKTGPDLDEIIESIKTCIREAATDAHPRRSLERLANLPQLGIVALEAGIDFEVLVEEVARGQEQPAVRG